jgi:tetratricopeptide (TPR) repeat protein
MPNQFDKKLKGNCINMNKYIKIALLVLWAMGMAVPLFSQNKDVIISDRNGLKLYTNGDFEKAAYVYERLLTMDKANTFFSYMLGVCYYELGDLNDFALSNLANSVVNMGSFSNSSPTDAHYYFAQALRMDNQFRKSIQQLMDYRAFVEEDLEYELDQVKTDLGAEITKENKKEYEEQISNNPTIIKINETLQLVDKEIEEIKEEELEHNASGQK